MEATLPLLVAIPLGGGFLCPVLGKFMKRRGWVELLAVVLMAVLLTLSIGQFLRIDRPYVYWVGGWWGGEMPIGISLVSDGLSRLLALTVNLVGLLAVVFSVSYMRRFTGPGLYYGLFLLMVAGMNTVVLTGDLFNLYVFLEVAAISSYALVAFGTESEELEASFKYLVLGGISSVFILFGIGIIYNMTGHLNMAEISASLAAMTGDEGRMRVVWLAAAMFLMGFGLKAAMVPFHAWLPDAHPSAPAPISAMLSGVLIKAVGVYALARLLLNVLPPSAEAGYVVMTMGVASMVIGGLLAVGQGDLKRLLAYSSISQVGYVVLAVGLAAVLKAHHRSDALVALALFGGLFHLFNHAVFKSLLFLCSGAVEQATGTRELARLGGLSSKMPLTSGCCRIGALSIIGVPPFNGFWSKVVIIIALASAGYWVLAVVAVAVSVLTLLMFAKVQRDVLDGEPSEATRGAREAPAAMGIAMALLALVCLAAGLATPQFKTRLADPAVESLQAGSEPVTADEAEAPGKPAPPSYWKQFRPGGSAASNVTADAEEVRR